MSRRKNEMTEEYSRILNQMESELNEFLNEFYPARKINYENIAKILMEAREFIVQGYHSPEKLNKWLEQA